LVYRFGDFTLDPGTRQLPSDGVEVHLAPKAFDLLVLLVANRARAVSKEGSRRLRRRHPPSCVAVPARIVARSGHHRRVDAVAACVGAS
jgi:hypothetical protein